jgi:uncharacterized C2H2 Zn-finger protein
MAVCNICNNVFARERDLTRHVMSLHQAQKFECDVCKSSFNRNENLLRHMKNVHRRVGGTPTRPQEVTGNNVPGIYYLFVYTSFFP